jgi:hypothetical protein
MKRLGTNGHRTVRPGDNRLAVAGHSLLFNLPPYPPRLRRRGK